MRLVLAGGGTGGHVYPAISIAEEFVKRNEYLEVLFIGTEKGLESKILPAEGFVLKKIKVRGFARKISIENFIAVKEVLFSVFQVYKILKNFKPDIVVGTGGYVSGSVLMTASLMGIPTLIHEQNAIPGITNRILSRFADKIALTFEEAKKYIHNQEKVKVTGNPVRNDILATNNKIGKETFDFKYDLPLLFIVGGSRGAKSINENVELIVKECIEKKEFQILHMTGETQYEDTMSMYSSYNLKDNSDYIKVLPYIHNMSYALAGADLIISRCGAGLIAEITVLGKPSILIPYPYATDNHQEFNARAMESKGAAIVILEKDLNKHLLATEVKNIFKNKDCLRVMAMQSKKLGHPNATMEIVNIMQEMLKERND